MSGMNLDAFTSALAETSGSPVASFVALEALARHSVGARLFTLMAFDQTRFEGERIYSNVPEAYPVSGRKALPRESWASTVLERQEIFVANSIEGIAAVFPDHELIRSLGCESVLNIPIVVAGRVLGTVNCLDRAGAYTASRLAAAESLRLPGAACFLLTIASSSPEWD